VSLLIKNNSKFVRGKKRATEDTEHYRLEQYNVKRRAGGEYELKVPYGNAEDLDQTMCELLRDIASHADERNCFSESDACMEGTDRRW
jgi:hypothetical protein